MVFFVVVLYALNRIFLMILLFIRFSIEITNFLSFFSCRKMRGLAQTGDVPTDHCSICQKMGGMKNCPLNMHHQNKPHTQVKRNTKLLHFRADSRFDSL